MRQEHLLIDLPPEPIIYGLLASIADAVVTIDEEHRVAYCNRAAETMFGYGKEEL